MTELASALTTVRARQAPSLGAKISAVSLDSQVNGVPGRSSPPVIGSQFLQAKVDTGIF